MMRSGLLRGGLALLFLAFGVSIIDSIVPDTGFLVADAQAHHANNCEAKHTQCTSTCANASAKRWACGGLVILCGADPTHLSCLGMAYICLQAAYLGIVCNDCWSQYALMDCPS